MSSRLSLSSLRDRLFWTKAWHQWKVPILGVSLSLSALGLILVPLMAVAVVVLFVLGLSPAAAAMMGVLGLGLWATVAWAFWFNRSPHQRYPRDFRRLIREAEKGSSLARWALVKAYQTGQAGAPKDFIQAAAWLRILGESGDPEALTQLAQHHWNGSGILRDRQLALAFLQKAAQQGHPPAQAQLKQWEAALGNTWSQQEANSTGTSI